MRKPPHLDGVQSALNDLINLEQERLDKETAERKAAEEAERKRREDEERRRLDEEERRRKEQEEARLAKEKAERDEAERKVREKELDELRLKKEMDMKQRLEEERLRMDHEKQVKSIEAQAKKGFPKWVIGVIAGVFVVAAIVVTIVLVQMKKRADDVEKARLAAEQKMAEKEKEREAQIAQLQTLLGKMEDKANLTEQELSQQKALQEQLKKLQDDQAQAASTKKKKKKKKKPTEKKGPSLDLGDPLSGI